MKKTKSIADVLFAIRSYPYIQDQTEKEKARADLFAPEGACTALLVG